MENRENKQAYETTDWDDDSGEIHTVESGYKYSYEDGWKNTHRINKQGGRHRMIRGNQVGYHYITDDYRKVIPGYIIATVLVIAVCVAVTLISVVPGIIFDVFGAIWIIGFWSKAPYKKWRNQAERIKEEKNEAKNDPLLW